MIKELDKLFECGWEAYYYDEKVRCVHNQMREMADKYYEIINLKDPNRDLIIDSLSMKKDLLRLSKELAWVVKEAKEIEITSVAPNEMEKAKALLQLARESQELTLKSQIIATNNQTQAQKKLRFAQYGVAASILIALLSVGWQTLFPEFSTSKIEYIQVAKAVSKAELQQNKMVKELRAENSRLSKKMNQLEKEIKSLRNSKSKDKFADQEDTKPKTEDNLQEAKVENMRRLREFTDTKGSKV
ncbi:MAG: hypothetical protein ACOYL6_06950 [Bacteriovoracaceae bacterium]